MCMHSYTLVCMNTIMLHIGIYSIFITNPCSYLLTRSIRFISESAERLNLTSLIPCHTNIHCATFSPHRIYYSEVTPEGLPITKEYPTPIEPSEISVIAGHFTWGVSGELLPAYLTANGDGSVSYNKTLVHLTTTLSHIYGMNGSTFIASSTTTLTNTTSTTYIHASPSPYSSVTQFPAKIMHTNRTEAPHVPNACFIMGRHPVDRSISYYYQRCYYSPTCLGYGKMINDLTREHLWEVAVMYRSGVVNIHSYDEVMNFDRFKDAYIYDLDQQYIGKREDLVNEDDVIVKTIADDGMAEITCRLLSNTRNTTGSFLGNTIVIPGGPTPAEVAVAVTNADKCVIGLLERWPETKKVMNEWFPWIDMSHNSDRRKMQVYKDSDKETMHTLRPELYDILIHVNPCDMLLYNNMITRFNKQIEVLQRSKKIKEDYFLV